MWEICYSQFCSLEGSYIFQALKIIWKAVTRKHGLSIQTILLDTLSLLFLEY